MARPELPPRYVNVSITSLTLPPKVFHTLAWMRALSWAPGTRARSHAVMAASALGAPDGSRVSRAITGRSLSRLSRLLERQAQDIGIGVVGECVTMGNDNDK